MICGRVPAIMDGRQNVQSTRPGSLHQQLTPHLLIFYSHCLLCKQKKMSFLKQLTLKDVKKLCFKDGDFQKAGISRDVLRQYFS